MTHARLLEYLISFKNSHNEELFELIINEFKNLIKKYVNKVEEKDREDIKQEILMKIHKICLSFNIIDNISLEENGKQFTKYIEKTIINVYYDYLRNRMRKNKIVNITEKNKKPKKQKINLEYLISKGISNKDIEFLKLYYKDTKILTDKEVAKILNVSQQAVNKRKLRIYRKIKK